MLQIQRVQDCSYWLQKVSEDYNSNQSIAWYIDQLGLLCNTLAFINEQMAISKRLLTFKKQYAYDQFVSSGLVFSPSIIKDYINSRCAEEQYNYEICERVSRTVYHTIEALRSILSALKEEMKTTYTVTQQCTK